MIFSITIPATGVNLNHADASAVRYQPSTGRHVAFRYKTKAAKDWMEMATYLLVSEMNRQEWRVQTSDEQLSVTIYYYANTVRPDLDGSFKALLDALRNAIQKHQEQWDDKWIAEIRSRKLVDPDHPRFEMVVFPTPESDRFPSSSAKARRALRAR